METLIEGDELYHPTTRGLPQLLADFRTSIFIRDDVLFISKIPIYVVNMYYFLSNEIIAREYRRGTNFKTYGIKYELLPGSIDKTLIDKKSFLPIVYLEKSLSYDNNSYFNDYLKESIENIDILNDINDKLDIILNIKR